MPQRSRIPVKNIAKKVMSALTQDFVSSSQLINYQLTKETFNLRHPFGAKNGKGDALQLVGMRITDMCNLRCHSCGQWGDNGYLIGQSLKELKKREVPVEHYKKLVDDVIEQGY